MKACLAEVIAEAKDTGDYPMYGEEMLLQSAKWNLRHIKRCIPISRSTLNVNKCFDSHFTNAWIVLYNIV